MALRSYLEVRPRLADGVYVDDTALVVGDVDLGRDVSVWPMSVVRGDVNPIRVGPLCNIQDGSVLHVTRRSPSHPHGYPLYLGEGVTLGHRVVLHGCHIGNYCLLGIGAVVLDGATLEDRVVLGAGSLAPPGKVLTGGHLWLGSPARCVRPLSDEELTNLEQSAQRYVALKNQYLTGARDG